MGVTVPAGVTSISAPPMRNSSSIGNPPVLQFHQNPLLFQQPQQMALLPTNKPQMMHTLKSQAPILSELQGKNSLGKPAFTVTVFVGNITERASDMLIRQLLSKCGAVNNWKRVQGPNGKLQAFGFCEYCNPESALRAIRLLHDFEISDKKLIVRVDAKTQEKLDEYFQKNKSNNSNNSSEDKADSDNAEPKIDEATKEEDKIVRNQISIVLKEHETELEKKDFGNEDSKRREKRHNITKDVKNENLIDLDMEDEKRSLIHREIDKFRDTYKKYDEEKEEEKRKKEEDRAKRSDRSAKDETRSRSKDQDERRLRLGRDRRTRRSNTQSPDIDRDRSGSPLDEEEILLKRRNEKMLREKEQSYQRRLRNWESRERRKAKENEKEREKEIRRKEEEEIERLKLKQFLQDYDDERHDSKYYKGKVLSRRLMDRQKEIEQDLYEREQERKELDVLKQKLAEEGHPDPDSEVRKRLNVNEPHEHSDINDRIKMLMNEARNSGTYNDEDSQGSFSNMRGSSVKTFGFAGMKISGSGSNIDGSLVPNGSSTSTDNHSKASNKSSSVEVIADKTKSHSKVNNKELSKRKRLQVSDVFNSNEDDEVNVANGKKRRPPPNALLEDSNTDSNLSTGSAANANINNKQSQSSSQLSHEEKRRQIKNLIDKIPTSKDELFCYNIEWDLLDNNLMERRIRPWINKKISDYIGEEEQTLLNFICKKLLTKSTAQSLLDDVAMVLDEEAQVFVVKLWRLLIYEIEAKKIGLNK
ncbi:putative RNA-binding protein 25 [Blomia tropicalis]|nr:putative RNA-binding protein 25 [Blomia tropicalis]